MALDDISDLWPRDVFDDYPAAAIRLTTVNRNGLVYLLFGYIELMPKEIEPPAEFNVEALRLGQNRVKHSVSVVPTGYALDWYCSALRGELRVPRAVTTKAIVSVPLAAEPQVGRFVVARTPPVNTPWHAGPRMHRLVPMEELPEPVRETLKFSDPQNGRGRVQDWLKRHVFVDLTKNLDCAGGMTILAPNPVLRAINIYPVRAGNGRGETLRIVAIPRTGYNVKPLSVAFREIRPDGYFAINTVALDQYGKADIYRAQVADRVALEIVCPVRGPLFVGEPTHFLRTIQSEIRLVRAAATVEVPARRKKERARKYSTHQTITAGKNIVGDPIQITAGSRLSYLKTLSEQGSADSDAELVSYRDRDAMIAFVSRLIFDANQIVLFVDRYFDSIDARQFAVWVSLNTCTIAFLTGRDEGLWKTSVGGSKVPRARGDVMVEDISYINSQRHKIGSAPLEGRVMGKDCREYHDRFLVVDQDVWHFGHSFNRLGSDSVSMVSRLRRPELMLDSLISDFAKAEPFSSYWATIK